MEDELGDLWGVEDEDDVDDAAGNKEEEDDEDGAAEWTVNALCVAAVK
jgi:hypothetical protein